MFNKKLLITFLFLVLFFFGLKSPTEAAVCGSFSITVPNDKCTGTVCSYTTSRASGDCYSSGSRCEFTYTPAGSSCNVITPTITYKCSGNGNSCSSPGASCGVAACSCSTGGSCSGSGSSCGSYGTGTCNCGPSPGTCIQSGVLGSCLTAARGTTGGICGPTCTWGAYSACSAACGPGTKTRTSTCGAIETVACNLGVCCGNGTCTGGETCSSCPSDCGACVPPPSGPVCGNGSCQSGESCNSCAADCGACPTSPPSCSPSCSNACGQNDGCGGSCGNSDSGTPIAPTGLNPASGAAIVSGNGQVTVSWNVVSKADYYEVQIYPTGTPAGQECTVANHHCPTPMVSDNYTFTLDPGVASYTWRVRGINSTCSTQNGPWSTSNFTLGGSFTGSLFDDSGDTAEINPVTGLCEAATTTPLAVPGGTSVQAQAAGNTITGAFTGSGFTISNVGYDSNSVVSLSLPAGYRCSCPAGCTYSGVSVPLGNVHFYVTTSPLGWWQSANAYLFAGTSSGTALQSKIPDSCKASPGTCTAAVSMYDATNTPKSDSTSLTGGGSLDSTANATNTYSYLNESGSNSHAEGMSLNGPREDYTYFSQQYGITGSTTSNFGGNQPASNGPYYSNTSVTVNNAWTLNTADSYVVFVNGDLTIKQPIRVAKGAFVAFIVKGNIIFDKTLGSNSSNLPSVAGVFIADGQIISQSNSPGDELKLVAEGTFVGWTGIQLQRNFNNANSARGNTEPIEIFNFRPDFLVTIPDKMTKPLYLWQETN